MANAPIVLFVYNRADHFIKTYNALSQCPEAVDSDLYIFSDGSKNEKSLEGVQAVRAAAREIENENKFKRVFIIESPENKGLARSVINGVTSVIKEYGKVIVVEDDCQVSPYFLKFMNNCLDYFESNKKIGAVTGYAPPVELPKDYGEDIFTAYRSCSWTWGTWADRWENIDWDLKDFKAMCKSTQFIKKLNSNGTDRFIRLYRQTKGNGSSWSVRFGAHLVKNNMVTVYPRYSYVQNIGCDESGVHSKSEDASLVRVDISKAVENPCIREVELNNSIQKILKKFYSGSLVSRVKRAAATIIIVIRSV